MPRAAARLSSRESAPARTVRREARGGVGDLGDFGDLAGTLGTSGAGDDGSGFATLAAAQLPFTGLPLWAAALAGLATLVLGLALWRRGRGELTEPA